MVDGQQTVSCRSLRGLRLANTRQLLAVDATVLIDRPARRRLFLPNLLRDLIQSQPLAL